MIAVPLVGVAEVVVLVVMGVEEDGVGITAPYCSTVSLVCFLLL